MENLADRIAAFLMPSGGSGSGSGSGSGYGSGYGCGYGCGCGYGTGYGCGNGVSSINGRVVYIVDGISTVFYSVRGNVARGAILNPDLTMTPIYIVRVGDSFAHGSSIESARRDAAAMALVQLQGIVELSKQPEDA